MEKELVLQAIRHYVEKEKAERLEKSLDAWARCIRNTSVVYKLRWRLALFRADAALIEEFLELLPEDKARFFRLRYLDKIPITFLALKLFMTPKQLIGWNHALQSLLLHLLQGRISENVLSPEKLRLSQRRLETLLDAARLDGGEPDADYLGELESRKARLELAAARIDAYVAALDNPAERAAVAQWMRDNATYVELSYAHHISEASARRYIIKFKTHILG